VIFVEELEGDEAEEGVERYPLCSTIPKSNSGSEDGA